MIGLLGDDLAASSGSGDITLRSSDPRAAMARDPEELVDELAALGFSARVLTPSFIVVKE